MPEATKIVRERKWTEPPQVDLGMVHRVHAEVAELCRQEGVPEFPLEFCRILVQRGLTDLAQIRTFLSPNLEHFHDPFLMKDMDVIVAQLNDSREAGERILVLGDYDVDGLSSTWILQTGLEDLGFEVVAEVPDRFKDGYGISMRYLKKHFDMGVRTVITCDTGITEVEKVRIAVEEWGMKVLITDHHHTIHDEAGNDVIPAAQAVVNPQQQACGYPEKYLCGAGVAFKVIQALSRSLGRESQEFLNRYLPMAALGTVCDVVPLIGENRAFVKLGLKEARKQSPLGLIKLMEVAGITPQTVNEVDFGYQLGPRLNAIGRMADAGTGKELLRETEETIAAEIAQELEYANNLRKTVQTKMEREAVEGVESLGDLSDVWGLTVFLKDGHHGVVGIVAGKLVDHYCRPAFVFAWDEHVQKWKGSGRAPRGEGIHLKHALDECKKFLAKYGGHEYAAGATLEVTDEEGMKAFARAFNDVMRKQMSDEDRMPSISVDLEVGFGDLNAHLCRLIQHFGPFGEMNPPIRLLTREVTIKEARAVGDGTHISFKMAHEGVNMGGIAFGLVKRLPELVTRPKPYRADIVYRIKENVWNGKRELQAEVEDVRVISVQGGDASLSGGAMAGGLRIREREALLDVVLDGMV